MVQPFAVSLLIAAIVTVSPISTFFLGGIGAGSATIQMLLLGITIVATQFMRSQSSEFPTLVFSVACLLLAAAVLAEVAHVMKPMPYASGESSLTRRVAVLATVLLIILAGSLARMNLPRDITWRGMRIACVVVAVYSVYQWYLITGLRVTLSSPRSAEILSADSQGNWMGANLFSLFALFAAVTALFFRRLYITVPILLYSLMLAISFGSRNTILAIIAGYIVFFAARMLHSGKLVRWALCGYAAILTLAFIWILIPGLGDWVANTVFQLDNAGRGSGSGFTGRTEIWQRIIAWWLKSPIVGNGFRTSPEYPHNGYLQVLGEMGIVGLIWFATSLVTGAWYAFRQSGQREFAAVLAYIVAFAFYNIFDSRPVNASNAFTLGFYFLWAFVIGPGNKSENPAQEKIDGRFLGSMPVLLGSVGRFHKVVRDSR